MTWLMTINESAKRTAAAIKNILDVDVVIIDEELNRIADTFGYGAKEIVIRPNSIVGMIIQTGKSLAIDDKERFESCSLCTDREDCRMQSLIGVPILLKERVVGAIGLVIPKASGKNLFDRLDYTIDFLNEMAYSLAYRLQAAQDSKGMMEEKRERELLIDCMEDAAAILDSRGLIKFSNRQFNRRFFSGSRTVNIPLENVIQDKALLDKYRRNQEVQDLRVSCSIQGKEQSAFCTLKFLEPEGAGNGAILILRAGTPVECAPPTGMTVSEVMVAEMKKYLNLGMSKSEIASILGVSRATLYRKLKNERMN
ncbi:MAG: helix-turn-helix domain-containing protein [Clostridiales bacterium]|nr:helix-turn-helix domain-containing protein [Clostridiales bacterium]